MKSIGLYWRTIRYLTLRQLVFQVWHRIRGRPRLRIFRHTPEAHFLATAVADKPDCCQNGTFTFLNQPVTFSETIDWNYSANGKLWTYHLNYFDFLNQPNMSAADGLTLIQSFTNQTDTLRDGLEPYPTSLRIVNWIEFLSRNQLNDPAIQMHLWAQVRLLCRRVEYHLAGNHLLENGLALMIAALFFRQQNMWAWAFNMVRKELTKQILADGCHAERSPMYHAILLDRLLTVLYVQKSNSWRDATKQIEFLTDTAQRMMHWLTSCTFRAGELPMMNDAALGIGPNTAQLQAKMCRIGITERENYSQKQPESGYRMIRQPRYELFVDVGAIGPDYQPGHAHADSLSFLLNVDNQPVFVDTGTSTYELRNRRAYERSTAAHNTVEVDGKNSSEVWAAFRVGRRARVRMQTDSLTELKATHDGYAKLSNVLHERSWQLFPDRLVITDVLRPIHRRTQSRQKGIARFHLHPLLRPQISSPDKLDAGLVQLVFSSPTQYDLKMNDYQFANGFNQLQRADCVEVVFEKYLQTIILISA